MTSVHETRNTDVSRTLEDRFLPLPGADLIERGLKDLGRDHESQEAYLVLIGAPRLRRLGIAVEAGPSIPEHRLYRLLAEELGDGAHSAYNALVRRLVSFERAAEACAS